MGNCHELSRAASTNTPRTHLHVDPLTHSPPYTVSHNDNSESLQCTKQGHGPQGQLPRTLHEPTYTSTHSPTHPPTHSATTIIANGSSAHAMGSCHELPTSTNPPRTHLHFHLLSDSPPFTISHDDNSEWWQCTKAMSNSHELPTSTDF